MSRHNVNKISYNNNIKLNETNKPNYIFDDKGDPAPVHSTTLDSNQKLTTYGNKLSSDNGFNNNNQDDDDINEAEEKPGTFEEEDLDDLVYDDAAKFDTRGMCYFLWRCMKLKVIILSPFSNVSVLEPFCIRLLGFFLNISLFFVFNGIFYDPSYISKRYKEKTSTGFVYFFKNEIPKCIYASIASTIIGLFIMYISTAKKRFITVIDKEKDHMQFLKKTKDIVKSLKIKIIIFFIIDIVLMCAFWYYVSAFCAVYQKTQMPWLEGSLVTFVFCLMLQALYAVLITSLRYLGLKCKLSCFYTISKYML